MRLFYPRITLNKDVVDGFNKERKMFELAAKLHSTYCDDNYKQTDGTYKSRIKETKDPIYIKKHNTNKVDIANTSFENLPLDYQVDNFLASKLILELVEEKHYETGDYIGKLGTKIHNDWIKRNTEYAKSANLDIPFENLSADEQKKDVLQFAVALNSNLDINKSMNEEISKTYRNRA